MLYRMVAYMKSMGDFYVSQGICRTELAKQLGMPEETLENEEALAVPTEEMRVRLTALYNLPADWFLREEQPEITPDGKRILNGAARKRYFFKVSLVWQFLVAFAVAAPVSVFSVTYSIFSSNLYGKEPLLSEGDFIRVMQVLSELLIVLSAFAGILLAKYIIKRTAFCEGVRKYQFFYWLLPDAMTAAINFVFLFCIGLSQETENIWKSGISSFLSIPLLLAAAWLCAELLDAAVTKDIARRRKKLRILCGLAVGSRAFSFVLAVVGNALQGISLSASDWLHMVLRFLLLAAAAAGIGFFPDTGDKHKKLCFTVLPLAAMFIDIPFGLWAAFAAAV